MGSTARLVGAPHQTICGNENGVLSSLRTEDRELVERDGELVTLERGEVLFAPGLAVPWTHFPSVGTVIALCLLLADGRTVEAATIGCEGVIGGVASCGTRPAFASAIVQIGGPALRVPVRLLEDLKDRSPAFRRAFDCHADFLLVQTLQSVACNTFHSLEARLCRWLLTTQDRIGADEIALTQEALADMLGVQRTTVSSIARCLQNRGLVNFRRGHVRILNRAAVELASCECYATVERYRRSSQVGAVISLSAGR